MPQLTVPEFEKLDGGPPVPENILGHSVATLKSSDILEWTKSHNVILEEFFAEKCHLVRNPGKPIFTIGLDAIITKLGLARLKGTPAMTIIRRKVLAKLRRMRYRRPNYYRHNAVEPPLPKPDRFPQVAIHPPMPTQLAGVPEELPHFQEISNLTGTESQQFRRSPLMSQSVINRPRHNPPGSQMPARAQSVSNLTDNGLRNFPPPPQMSQLATNHDGGIGYSGDWERTAAGGLADCPLLAAPNRSTENKSETKRHPHAQGFSKSLTGAGSDIFLLQSLELPQPALNNARESNHSTEWHGNVMGELMGFLPPSDTLEPTGTFNNTSSHGANDYETIRDNDDSSRWDSSDNFENPLDEDYFDYFL